MQKLTYEEVLALYNEYKLIEVRANKIILKVNMIYITGRLNRMRELLKGFSTFAAQISKAMTSIANDLKRILTINEEITKIGKIDKG